MTLRVTPAEIVAAAEASGTPGLLAVAQGWGRVRLGDVANVVNGAPFGSQHFNVAGVGMPLIRIRDVRTSEVSTWYDGPWQSTHLVEPGALLVGMDGDFNAATWRGPVGLLNQRVCRVDVDTDRYSRQFLEYALQGYLDAIWKATSSTTVKHLSSRSIADIPLPNPALNEQRRIVEILDDHLSRLDAANDYLSAASFRARSLEDQTVLRALLPEMSGSAVAELVDGTLPPLPGSWTWQRLGDVAHIVGGVTKDAKKQSDPANVEVPYLRVANVQRTRLDLSDVATIRVRPAQAEALRLQPGDVLMNEGGDRDKLARGWVWQGQIADCIHQNHVFRARPTVDLVRSEWLAWCANTYGSRWAQRHGRQSVNLASISLSTLSTMPVPVAPLADQETHLAAIERVRTAIGSTAEAVEDARRRSGTLRRALLAAAFSGRLTGRSSDLDLAEEMALA